MGRLVKDSNLGTREARRKLTIRKTPYWRLIVEGIHLGYYKGSKTCTWQVKARSPQSKYKWEVIGSADDYADANGKTIFNYSQAQEIAKAKGVKIQLGDEHANLKPYTIDTAINDYLEDFMANGKKSLYSTKTQINAHIMPYFGGKIVSKLTFNQLNTWKNTLATTDKRARTGLGKSQQYRSEQIDDPDYQRRRRSSTNRIITILKAILNHAFNTNRVQSNEAWMKLKPFKNVAEPKIRFLTEDEATRLMNACEPDFRQLVRGALLTGARYGELTSLKVGDYSTDNQTIFVQQSKNGKPRHIPLNNEGVSFFEQLCSGRSSTDFVFTRTNGSQWKKNYQIRPLDAACKASKIAPSINFHILRHTYGSTLAMRGVPLQVISAVLGHSDTRITHKHYAHLMPSYIADVIKQHLPNFGKTYKSNVSSITKTLTKIA